MCKATLTYRIFFKFKDEQGRAIIAWQGRGAGFGDRNMLNVHLKDADDNLITIISMNHSPAVGDIIWLQPRREQSDYKVVQVCHWASDTIEYHNVCVYVEPV